MWYVYASLGRPAQGLGRQWQQSGHGGEEGLFFGGGRADWEVGQAQEASMTWAIWICAYDLCQ